MKITKNYSAFLFFNNHREANRDLKICLILKRADKTICFRADQTWLLEDKEDTKKYLWAIKVELLRNFCSMRGSPQEKCLEMFEEREWIEETAFIESDDEDTFLIELRAALAAQAL